MSPQGESYIVNMISIPYSSAGHMSYLMKAFGRLDESTSMHVVDCE